jgi:hypothetical protein
MVVGVVIAGAVPTVFDFSKTLAGLLNREVFENVIWL